jgi:hypothetical protein
MQNIEALLRIRDIGTDPDPWIRTSDPDPAIFVNDIQDGNKKLFFFF